MTKSRKLEEIAANLDDLSITLEEIKEEITSDDTRGAEKLDKVYNDIERAVDGIEESLTPDPPER